MVYYYPPDAKSFLNNGLGVVNATYAVISKVDNGDYALDIECPISEADKLTEGYILGVDTPWGRQGFRVSSPEKTERKIKARCWHVYYDSKNYLIYSVYIDALNTNAALDAVNSATDVASPFSFTSDVAVTNTMQINNTTLHSAVEQIIGLYGGHITRDNYDIGVAVSPGSDNGALLAYGKNITGISVTEDWSNVATKILPVGKDEIMLESMWVSYRENDYPTKYSKVVEFSQDINSSDYETYADYEFAVRRTLEQQANNYLYENHFPKVSYTVSAYFPGVKDIGDRVVVKHPRCNVDIYAAVTSVKYNCISERITEVTFGNFMPKLGNYTQSIIEKVGVTLKKSEDDTRSWMASELKESEDTIYGVLGNSYVIYDGNRILAVDRLPKESANNVLMISSGGIGFSRTGIAGTFTSAWTIDGTMNMQNFNVINLVADLIKGGTLKLGGLGNTNGRCEVYDSTGRLFSVYENNGLTFYNVDGSSTVISGTEFAGYDDSGNRTFWVDWDEFHMENGHVETELVFGEHMKIVTVNYGGNTGIAFAAVDKEE